MVGHAHEDVATNDLLFDWPCYPAVSPELSYSGQTGDYFHGNSIDLWPGSVDTGRSPALTTTCSRQSPSTVLVTPLVTVTDPEVRQTAVPPSYCGLRHRA